jgi:ankyrin repeat protein
MMQALDREGRSPLHYVPVDLPRDGQVVEARRLLAEGCNPNAQDKRGWTPLHFAAQGYAIEFAELILAAGAAVDARDGHGNTPLSTAVFNSRGHGEMIALLRRHGADPHAQNNHGVSPVSLARDIGNYDVAQFFADLPGGEE